MMFCPGWVSNGQFVPARQGKALAWFSKAAAVGVGVRVVGVGLCWGWVRVRVRAAQGCGAVKGCWFNATKQWVNQPWL